MAMQPLRIVFDLDDTLYLERDFAFSGFDAVGAYVASRHGITGFAKICRELFDGPHRSAIFDEALRIAGLAGRQPVAELVALYRGHDPQVALCPDAKRFLNAGRGPFGLITDGPEATQRAKIAALGLDAFCDQVIPTGQWPKGFGKPHPRAYEEIEASARGRRCVYVADNAAKDFVTPNRLGWLTVQILRPERVHDGAAPDAEHAAQTVITSLDQLEAKLSAV
ncbi:HAD family hydrolase [Paracoccus aurantiacus]|uniref:HAD family hydrolase n=1 Tax=Paracoccus aurantiacus TaxID=2599412 RepID=A0A5C6RYH8_9RHOB|nr:HAD family hydrolase [Paracoccus aurantiacus]TXB66422.1 HAD family hydrolase [Paracoccus aurantiacus]